MSHLRHLLTALLCILPLPGLLAAEPYGYPLDNPLKQPLPALQTLMPKLPDNRDIKQKDYSFNLRPEREHKLPDNFGQ